MRSPVTASGRDLRALAEIVTDERADVPAEGLPPSLLTELADLIRCDQLSFFGVDNAPVERWPSPLRPSGLRPMT
jgi:hypothetical protein